MLKKFTNVVRVPRSVEEILLKEPRSVDEAFAENLCFSVDTADGRRVHLYIAAVRYDSRSNDNRPYIEMELIDGEGIICAYKTVDNESLFGTHKIIYEDAEYEIIVKEISQQENVVSSVRFVFDQTKSYSADENQFIRRVYKCVVDHQTCLFYQGGFEGLYRKVMGKDVQKEEIARLVARGVLYYKNNDDFYFEFL